MFFFNFWSLLNSIEIIAQKTDFTNQQSKCSSSCYTIVSNENVGFTVFSNKNTADLNERIQGSIANIKNNEISFEFLKISDTLNLNSLDSNTKSAFFLNTSVSSETGKNFKINNCKIITTWTQFFSLTSQCLLDKMRHADII